MSSDKAKVVEAEWGTRGFTCELWVDRPGKEWKDFVHNVDELLMAVEGEIELDMNGQTLRPQLGEEILSPAGVSHSVRNTGKTTARWLFGYKT